MEVLKLLDDIENRFMTGTHAIHRICIPATGGLSDSPGRMHLKVNGGHSVYEHAEVNEAGQTKDAVSGSPGKWNIGLRLSPDALNQPSQQFIDGFDRLLETKFGIMASRIRHGLDAWTLASYMVNPYESVSFVAKPSVINRAYFKMWELIHFFGMVPPVSQCQTLLSAHLCEGPGGFIEAVLDFRERSLPSESFGQRTSDDVERHLRETGKLEDRVGLAGSSQTFVATQRPESAKPGLPNAHSSKVYDEKTDPHSISRLKREYSLSKLEVKQTTENSRDLNADIEWSTQTYEMVAGSNGCSQYCSPDSPFKRKHTAATIETTARKDAAPQFKCVHDAIHDLDPCRNSKEEVKASIPTCKPGGKTTAPSLQYRDMWFGITLAPTDHQSDDAGFPRPSLEVSKLNEKRAGQSIGSVHFGIDGSGDITIPANMQAFVEHTLAGCGGRKVDLVTADGAFDVSDDFASQEHSHLHLIFSEMVAAVRLQANGGSLVLKLFDCYTESTLTILLVLSTLYSRVEVARLRTTRVCNSERYVVATGFLGLDPTLEETLLKLTEEWHSCTLRGQKVGLCSVHGLPTTLLETVMESNATIAASQIDGISRALKLADVIGEQLPSPNSVGSRKGAISMLRRKLNTLKSMQRNAVALCTELLIPYRSQFRGKSCDVPCV